MRKIGFLWWYNRYSKLLVSVLTIQKEALERMGHKVEIFNITTAMEDKDELELLNDCDLVFTSVLPLLLQMKLQFVDTKKYDRIKAPVFFQIDGYGATTFNELGCNPIFHGVTKKAALVTFLDMNVYEEFRKTRQPFEYDKIFFIPNGAEDLLEKYTVNEYKLTDEPLIGTLLKENYYKKPWIFLEAVKHLYGKIPSFRVLFPVLNWRAFNIDYAKHLWNGHSFGAITKKGFVKGIPYVQLHDIPNTYFMSLLPYRKIPNFIGSCDIFCHYSHGDAFGKTLTEAFSMGKAPLTSDIIRVQGVSTSKIDVVREQIGKPMREAYNAIEPLFFSGNGEHYIMAPRENPVEYAEKMVWIIEHPVEYAVMGAKARTWSKQWITWEEKWKHIFELCEERNIL